MSVAGSVPKPASEAWTLHGCHEDEPPQGWTRQERVIAPQCLVIFGASGDLTHRKLVPALFELFKQRRLPSEFAPVSYTHLRAHET